MGRGGRGGGDRGNFNRDRDRDRGRDRNHERGDRDGDDGNRSFQVSRVQRDHEMKGDYGNPKRMRMQDRSMNPEIYYFFRNKYYSRDMETLFRIPRTRCHIPVEHDQFADETRFYEEIEDVAGDEIPPVEHYRACFRDQTHRQIEKEIYDNVGYYKVRHGRSEMYYAEDVVTFPCVRESQLVSESRKVFNQSNPLFGNRQQQQRILEKIRNIDGSDVVAKQFEIKKFTANTRLYIGNIASDATEEDLKELFQPYGELDEVFLNREKNFAFLKMDFRSSTEKARSELDGNMLKGKPLKIRFAPACVRLKVKNLAPTISNEQLEVAFSVFGEIERALVFADEKGKSIGEGIVDFTRKNYAVAAQKFCQERCYFLSSELRPVETEIGEMYEMDEGLLEANLSGRQGGPFGRGPRHDGPPREFGPRVADEGSFEHEYGLQWKQLMSAFREKEAELKQQLQTELDNLHKKMELAKYDYETEMLRRQLRQREMEQERFRMQYEQRHPNNDMDRPGYSTGNNFNSMDQRDRFGFDDRGQSQQNRQFDNRMDGFPIHMNMGMDVRMQEMPRDDRQERTGDQQEEEGNANALAPPPLPPQGLMDLEGAGDASPAAPQPDALMQAVTWELNPFSMNFPQEGTVKTEEESPQNFGGTQKIFRDRPSRFSDAGGDGSGGRRGGSYNRGRGNYRGGQNNMRISRH